MPPTTDLNGSSFRPTSTFFTGQGDSLKTHVTQNKTLADYINYAIQLFQECDLPLPDEDHIILIVESALAVQNLFFTTCLRRPEQVELHQVFEAFLVSCVLPPEKRSNP
jgi:hypothetical protein